MNLDPVTEFSILSHQNRLIFCHNFANDRRGIRFGPGTNQTEATEQNPWKAASSSVENQLVRRVLCGPKDDRMVEHDPVQGFLPAL
jgi:hypothetical protein